MIRAATVGLALIFLCAGLISCSGLECRRGKLSRALCSGSGMQQADDEERKEIEAPIKAEKERQEKIAQEDARIRAAEQAERQQAFENETKKKYGVRPCFQPQLFQIIFLQRTRPESGCLYYLNGNLKILQSIPSGVLVGLAYPDPYLADTVVFVQTKREFADGEIVRDFRLRSIGLKKYTSVSGAGRTIFAFKDLDK